jgi:hypothetical protein
MHQATGCRILAIMGSGETSPTMVTVHRALVARLETDHPAAVLLETPYRFQENADDISARAQAYFSRSVGLEVTAQPGTRPPGPGDDGAAGVLRAADWVFAGPGSPTYALAEWRDSPVAGALRDRLQAGRGVTVLASAAAVTIGIAALPVYEIYKVGAAPYWLEGLDLLGAIGLKVALIPHYDNAEGGNHDTRYCYLGERRLSVLEQDLPCDAAVLGVDEHTAAVFDLRAETVEITGRGGVTVRRRGASTILPAGTVITLARLQDLVSRGAPPVTEAQPPPAPSAAAGTSSGGRAEDAPLALPDIIAAAERRFEAAERDADADGMVAAIIDLEAAIAAWAGDTEEDQGTEQARAVLRSLVTRLGQAAREGLGDPRDRLRSAVQPLVALRATLRREGSYLAADAIRDALAAAGLELQDTPEGPQWQLASGETVT